MAGQGVLLRLLPLLQRVCPYLDKLPSYRHHLSTIKPDFSIRELRAEKSLGGKNHFVDLDLTIFHLT